MKLSNSSIKSDTQNRMLPIKIIRLRSDFSWIKFDIALLTIQDIIRAYTRQTIIRKIPPKSNIGANIIRIEIGTKINIP